MPNIVKWQLGKLLFINTLWLLPLFGEILLPSTTIQLKDFVKKILTKCTSMLSKMLEYYVWTPPTNSRHFRILVRTPITRRQETLSACHSGWNFRQSTNLSSHRRRAKWSFRAWRRTLGIYGSFQTRRTRARGARNPRTFASAVDAPPWHYTWGTRPGGAPLALGSLSPGLRCSGARCPGGSTPGIAGKTRHTLSSNPRSRPRPCRTRHPPSTTFGFRGVKIFCPKLMPMDNDVRRRRNQEVSTNIGPVYRQMRGIHTQYQ